MITNYVKFLLLVCALLLGHNFVITKEKLKSSTLKILNFIQQIEAFKIPEKTWVLFKNGNTGLCLTFGSDKNLINESPKQNFNLKYARIGVSFKNEIGDKCLSSTDQNENSIVSQSACCGKIILSSWTIIRVNDAKQVSPSPIEKTVDPVQPVKPVEPWNPWLPFEPVLPWNPVKPVAPVEPVAP